jgi:hypothetical protein
MVAATLAVCANTAATTATAATAASAAMIYPAAAAAAHAPVASCAAQFDSCDRYTAALHTALMHRVVRLKEVERTMCLQTFRQEKEKAN